jgi:hypothetical protein
MKRRFFKDRYYPNNSNENSSTCFIYPDLCYCGHEKYHHSNLDKCNSNDCGCKEFLP